MGILGRSEGILQEERRLPARTGLFFPHCVHAMQFHFHLQIGNPDGADKPNKKFYDPRVWIRAAEESMIKRAHESFKCLNGTNVCGDDWPKSS